MKDEACPECGVPLAVCITVSHQYGTEWAVCNEMVPKLLQRIGRAEFDVVLDEVAYQVESILHRLFSNRVGFILLLGGQDYRGMVSNLSSGMDDIVKVIRQAADRIEAGQKDW